MVDLGAPTPRDYRPILSSRGSLARTSYTDLGAPHRPAGYRAGYRNYFNPDATLQDSSINHSTLLPGSYAVKPQTPPGHYLGPQAYERYLGPRGANPAARGPSRGVNPAFQDELSMTSSGTPRGFTAVFHPRVPGGFEDVFWPMVPGGKSRLEVPARPRWSVSSDDAFRTWPRSHRGSTSGGSPFSSTASSGEHLIEGLNVPGFRRGVPDLPPRHRP